MTWFCGNGERVIPIYASHHMPITFSTSRIFCLSPRSSVQNLCLPTIFPFLPSSSIFDVFEEDPLSAHSNKYDKNVAASDEAVTTSTPKNWDSITLMHLIRYFLNDRSSRRVYPPPFLLPCIGFVIYVFDIITLKAD